MQIKIKLVISISKCKFAADTRRELPAIHNKIGRIVTTGIFTSDLMPYFIIMHDKNLHIHVYNVTFAILSTFQMLVL